SWGTAAGVAAPFAIWEAGSMLSGGDIPSLVEVPGIIYDGIFGDGNSMTPKEAISNWQGRMDYMSNSVANLQEAGLEDLPMGSGYNFGLFSESAKAAAVALEHLHTVAGYSQEQINALTASLDPLSQEFLASGQAANDLEGQVGGLVQQMNASINSYTMTSHAVNDYNERIDALIERLGLSGDAANDFREQIWELAEGFTSGGEEAQQFEQKLNGFVARTLNNLTQGAQDGTKALKNLINSMNQAQNQGGRLNGLGAGGGGSSSSGKGAVLGVMHGGGYVMGWPKAHAGALISSLARDEVPLIARRGEYVVRSEAVTATTLPALKALNQGVAAPQASSPAVNLHVEIHGNMLGSRDNLEDLARLLENKLRELDRGRWKA
ncbi:MAG: hypothetical protein KQI62_19385, partial [Deltaproteobacteria bacterium]|nr:hypothetical protein [Deltaproteobacteria bacterium]